MECSDFIGQNNFEDIDEKSLVEQLSVGQPERRKSRILLVVQITIA
jgi:hypothetical protein